MTERGIRSLPVEYGRHRGPRVGWQPKPGTCEATVLAAAVDLLREYEPQGLLPIGPRTVTYRLNARGTVHAKEGVPYDDLPGGKAKLDATVRNVLTSARRAGIVAWSHIADGRSEADRAGGYTGRNSFLDVLQIDVEEFNLQRLMGQPARVEVWREAEGTMAVVSSVAREWGISTYSGSGDVPVSAQYKAGQRAMFDWLENERPQVILHCGDHDGAGVTNFLAFAENVEAFAGGSVDLTVRRFAVTPEQVETLVEPTGWQTPGSGHKWKSWPADWEHAAQLEAFDPPVLRDLLAVAIAEYLDAEILQETISAEAEIRADLAERLGLDLNQ